MRGRNARNKRHNYYQYKVIIPEKVKKQKYLKKEIIDGKIYWVAE